jgi:hypothetical protein
MQINSRPASPICMDGGKEKGAIKKPLPSVNAKYYLSLAYGHVSGPNGVADVVNALVFG